MAGNNRPGITHPEGIVPDEERYCKIGQLPDELKGKFASDTAISSDIGQAIVGDVGEAGEENVHPVLDLTRLP